MITTNNKAKIITLSDKINKGLQMLIIELIPREYIKVKTEESVDRKGIGEHFKKTGEVIPGIYVILKPSVDGWLKIFNKKSKYFIFYLSFMLTFYNVYVIFCIKNNKKRSISMGMSNRLKNEYSKNIDNFDLQIEIINQELQSTDMDEFRAELEMERKVIMAVRQVYVQFTVDLEEMFD